MKEVDSKVDRLAHAVIGAAIEVHRCLGPGLLESMYEMALCIELTERGISFTQQGEVAVFYKERPIGIGRVDLLIGELLIVELKAVDTLAPIHTAQALTYLRMTGHHLALLINFNVPILRDGIKRVAL